MATTSLWKVSGSLKKVLDYAENPDKTSLKNVIEYASDKEKTDDELFVTGINCEVERAYEMMTETKRQFGKKDKVVAYHGYQSFKDGEVTPEECHAIGVETAKRLWGDKYEVIVTTHLNTKTHLHNHFVFNSVSFVDGEKFRYQTADILALREVSDEVCKEFGKSVLEKAPFHGSSSVYWVHRNGGLTQTDIVKDDIDIAIAHSYSPQSFMQNMIDMGYRFNRSIFNEYPSILVPGRSKPIRLKSFGEDYTRQRLLQRIAENRYTHSPRIKFYYPVSYILKRNKRATWTDGILSIWRTLLDIFELMLTKKEEKHVPISPELRFEIQKLDKYIKQYEFMTANNIEAAHELFSFVRESQQKMDELICKRKKLDNKIRRAAPEEKEKYRAERRELSGEIAGIRDDIVIANDIIKNNSRVAIMIDNEHRLEVKQTMKNAKIELEMER